MESSPPLPSRGVSVILHILLSVPHLGLGKRAPLLSSTTSSDRQIGRRLDLLSVHAKASNCAPQYHGTVRAVTHLELGQGPSKPAQLPHTWSSPGGGDSQAEPAQELKGDDVGGWLAWKDMSPPRHPLSTARPTLLVHPTPGPRCPRRNCTG